MKYLSKSFSTPANSRAYVENWERVFGCYDGDMGTVWYIARTDTKEMFEIGKRGFWFADANGLSNDLPSPPITADREKIAELVKHYEFDAAKSADITERIVSFVGPGAIIVDEHELEAHPTDDDQEGWRGEWYRVVDRVYR